MSGITCIDDLLRECGVNEQTIDSGSKKSLDELGYCVVPPDPGLWEHLGVSLDELREIIDSLVDQEGWRGGMEGKEEFVHPGHTMQPGARRLGNLIDKHPCFGRFILWPKVLAGAYHIIRDEIKVSVVNVREPVKGDGLQELHIDWLPRVSTSAPFDAMLCFLFLDDARSENGAVRVVPGSHRIPGWPEEHVDVFKKHPDEIPVEVDAGSLVIVNQLTWHGGGLNATGARRRMMTTNIRHRRYKQLLNQKMYLSDDTKRSLNPAQSYLLAIREEDPTQAEKSVGAGAYRRAKFGLLEGETILETPPPVTFT
jgi:hypothetical protein